MSVRLHPYARMTGTIYFDDLSVEKLDLPEISNIGGFESDLPSYWNKGSEPDGATLNLGDGSVPDAGSFAEDQQGRDQ